MTNKTPNVLLIVTDQQRADHLGCAGNTLLRTPNLDRLARTGVRASNFHAASTTCMSNRATLMTGRLPSLHGVVHNGISLSRDHTTFVELLRAGGYATALIGKSHLQSFGYDGPARRRWSHGDQGVAPPLELLDARKRQRDGDGYLNEWTPDWRSGKRMAVTTPYYGFEHVELATFHGDQVDGDYARWLAQRHPTPDSLRGRANALPSPGYSAPQAWRTAMPEALYPSAWVGERGCDWLRKHVQGSSGKPFFLNLSFPDPHHPFTPPGRFWDMYEPEDMPLPPSFGKPGNSQLLVDVHRYTREGGSREGYGAYAVTSRECKETLALTYGMVSMIDEQVGQLLQTLQELGIEDDTVIIFTSDHGDMMGDHGIVLKGAMHFSGLTRVPFIWKDPCSRAAPPVLNLPSGTIDIAKTVLARCGLAPYNGIQGLNLLPWLDGQSQTVPPRPGVIVESEPVVLPHGRTRRYRLRSLVSEEWRLTLSNLPALCELYNLRTDPLEQHNLWHERAAERGQLCMQLLMELSEQADCSPLPTAIA
ncbi:sulfatase [Comamonas testosteroni]|uniref:sulfatase family protein n=1 Tax=Comamonas testosteroni TaxID=285 RepID=UPI0026F0F5ED|nr:sulfatase-like hydrolase/transferase [Comamonas testosteroni]WQD41689.1 sulfatase-like hydrolase/transferase [Comamonas testosteroni]